MNTKIKTTLSALVLASAVFGGGSAAFAGGDYYVGASSAPLYQDSVVPRTGAAVIAPDVKTGGDGDYYAGIDRNPVDTIVTGSISNGADAVVGGATPVTQTGGEGDYYQGISRR